MTVFARCKTIHDEHAGNVPFNQNIAIAVEGFHEMGFEIHFYKDVRDIYDKYQLGDIVLDGIYQVDYCLNKFGLKFPQIEYPKCLEKYLGRKIWFDTINNINAHPELWGNFVKPVKEKIFTGRVINKPEDLIGCGTQSENYEVIVSEPIDFIYEVRGTVYYDQLLDLRPYKGHWSNMNLIDTNVIKNAMKDWLTWDDRPNACVLDWGVAKTNSGYRTLLVEANSGCCYGPYSTSAVQYAKMISASISKVCGTKDECYFGQII